MNKISSLFILLVITLSTINSAHAVSDISAVEQQKIKSILEKVSKETGKKLPIDNIQSSPISNLLQVTSDLNIFYITSDGRYVVLGEILDTSKHKENWSITEQAARKLRIKYLATINEKDLIIFPATKNKIGTVYVFTDIDCSYCRKMHQNIKEYNDAGIEIRYLAYPRSGPNTQSFDKSTSVWCSKDKADSYTLATEGEVINKNICPKNPVLVQFELGRKMGVNGTPTMFLDNGIKIASYVDAKTLVQIFKETPSS